MRHAIPGGLLLLALGLAVGSPSAVRSAEPLGSARNRGLDGDRNAVEMRPRDRPPVALTSMSARRQDPLIDVAPAAFPLAVGQVAIEFTTPALRRMRSGDTITIGGNHRLVVAAIDPGEVTFGVVGGGAGSVSTRRTPSTPTP